MRAKKILAGTVMMAMCAGFMTGCGGSDSKSQFKIYSKCADIDASVYTGVEYVPQSREVTDDEVQSAIDSFCSDNSETTEDKENPIEDGSVVNIDYVETISGTEKDSQESYEITIGSDSLGDGTDDQLIGLMPGETETVSVTYPDDYDDTTLAGLTAEYEVTVNYIKVTTVPDYTDDLVNEATEGEYTTTDAYTEYLTDNLQTEKDESADKADRTAVLTAVRDAVTFDRYPEGEVTDYIQSIMTSIESSASNYGIDSQTYIQYFYGYSTNEAFLEYISTNAESVMKEKIVVSCIAMDNNLIADDEDIKEYRAKIMEEYSLESEDDIANYYSDEDIMFQATEENVLDFLMDSAVQTESTETADEE